MELELYKKVVKSNAQIFNKNIDQYQSRVKNAHEQYLHPFISNFCKSLKGNRVIDLGCGSGRDLSFFRRKELDATGFDCSIKMVEFCQTKGLQAEYKDFLSLSFSEGALDGVWAYTSFTLVPRTVFILMLARISKWLKPSEGVLGLGMRDGNEEGWKMDDSYQMQKYVARYTQEDLLSILASDFEILHIESIPDSAKENKNFIHLLCRTRV